MLTCYVDLIRREKAQSFDYWKGYYKELLKVTGVEAVRGCLGRSNENSTEYQNSGENKGAGTNSEG